MRYFYFPLQDTAIYEEFIERNAGLDEILEVGKTNEGVFAARSLVQFDLSQYSPPPQAKYELILYVAFASRLKAKQGVEVCQVSQSWSEGTGFFYQEVISTGDGATWIRNSSGSSWSSGSQGGSHLSVTASCVLANPVVDLSFDVTSQVQQWVSGSVSNFGFLVKFPEVDEGNTGNDGNIKCFSKDTHTIYRPALVAKWDDSVYNTGSQAWPTSSMQVVPLVNTFYREGEVVRVDLSVREKFPSKTFANSASVFAGNHYLPTSSYFSVVDELSGLTVIPFSSESRVSSNGNQSYFTFRVQNMYPLRYYRVLVRVDHDGLEEIFDTNTLFTVKQ